MEITNIIVGIPRNAYFWRKISFKKMAKKQLMPAGLEPVLSHTEKLCIELQTISTSNNGFAFHFIESCL